MVVLNAVPSPPPPPPAVCTNKRPPDNTPCTDIASGGKCQTSTILNGGYCMIACGVCSLPSPPPPPPTASCTNKRPPDNTPCTDIASGGKCQTSTILNGGYCMIACGVCSLPSPPPPPPPPPYIACYDTMADTTYTCAQQKSWGKCDDDWMVDGGYCRLTCGRCTAAPPPPLAPPPPPPPPGRALASDEFWSSSAGIMRGSSRFRVHGVNWFGFETSFGAPGLLWGAKLGMTDYLDWLAQQGFSAMRITLAADMASAPDSFYPPCTAASGCINYDKNPTLKGKTSGQILDAMIAAGGARGIYTVLSIHRDTMDGPITELWNEDLLTAANVALAKRYNNTSYVMGLDLKNEPHGSATWGTGDSTDWCAAAGRIGTKVASVNPKVLIFVEGIQNYGAMRVIWGSMLAGVTKCQPALPDMRKLVYSPHVYGPHVALITSNATDWDAWFGFIKYSTDTAIVVGEWGGFGPNHVVENNDNDAAFQLSFLQYLLARGFLDHFYWSLNWNSGDTGGITLDDSGNFDPWKVSLLSNLAP